MFASFRLRCRVQQECWHSQDVHFLSTLQSFFVVCFLKSSPEAACRSTGHADGSRFRVGQSLEGPSPPECQQKLNGSNALHPGKKNNFDDFPCYNIIPNKSR